MSKTNQFRANALRLSVSMAVAAGLTAGDVSSNAALAQDDETATEGRIQVTGSRIKRADIEGALPVTVIDRSQIELSGDISVADLLRSTNFNTFGSFRPQSGSTAQSFAGLSLRGLGEGRTLILIDGRRAPISPNVGSAQDLNAIPLAAVERIEILSDGASAIYGTDAIGGVVNIITRKDFNGAEMMYGRSAPKRPGGDTEEGSVIFGASSPNARVIGGASFNNRQIIWQRDRAWSSGGASIFSNNFHQSPTPGDWFIHPTNGTVPPGGCNQDGDMPGFSTAPGFELDDGSVVPICLYDFTALAADEADVRNQSLFMRGHFQINDDWATYAHGTVARVTSFGRYAPVPSSPWPGGLPHIPPGSPNHPGNPEGFNAGNTAGYDPAQDMWFTHRFAALGTRDQTVESDNYDLTLGFEGRLAMVDVDFGVRQSEYHYIDLGRNYVVGAIAQQAIDCFDADFCYNIYDPFSNDPDVMDSMIATINREAGFTQREAYAHGSMDMFEMGGGIAGLAFGAEYRDEDYFDTFDTLSSSGQIVGSAGNSAALGRDVTAVYFEALLPVTPDLEINVAGRHDDYSDYGSDFSPKISFRWQPLPDLTLRGSWGQGFAAPSLDILSSQPSFSAATTSHIPTVEAFGGEAGETTQVTTFQIANPNLGSEQSEQISLGFAWDATDWFNMSLDYYDIEITDRVAFVGVNTIAQCIRPGDWANPTQNCPPGLSEFPPGTVVPNPSLGLGVAYNPNTGAIERGQTGFTNLGTIETRGLDFNGRTNFDLDGWGSIRNMLALTYVNSFTVDGGPNIVGSRGEPKYRGTLTNEWTYGDFQVAWILQYVHGQPESGLPSWTVHDLQVNYTAPWNGRLTVGVRNIADKDPVVDPEDPSGRGFNFGLYSPYGRIPYFRYTQNF